MSHVASFAEEHCKADFIKVVGRMLRVCVWLCASAFVKTGVHGQIMRKCAPDKDR